MTKHPWFVFITWTNLSAPKNTSTATRPTPFWTKISALQYFLDDAESSCRQHSPSLLPLTVEDKKPSYMVQRNHVGISNKIFRSMPRISMTDNIPSTKILAVTVWANRKCSRRRRPSLLHRRKGTARQRPWPSKVLSSRLANLCAIRFSPGGRYVDYSILLGNEWSFKLDGSSRRGSLAV